MTIYQWSQELEPDEQAYVRQCFQYWMGNNGGIEPDVPEGMSKVRAETLKFHCKSLIDTTQRRRKMQELKVISFRAPEEFEKELAFEAAKIDVNKSVYIRTCLEIGRKLVLAFPALIHFFGSQDMIGK